MGVATACVLTVSLLLVGVFSLFAMNVEILLTSIESKNEIVLFLKDNVVGEDIISAEQAIKNLPNVSVTEYYPREQALEDYIKQMEGYENIFEELRNDNPLPNAFNVQIKDTTLITETVNQMTSFEFTESVKAPTDFAKILNKLKNVVSVISIVLLVALIAVSIVMISNSTKASVYTRRREINIMKYVGATNSFIRTPFFFEGLFTGLVSGIGASVITYFGYTALMDIITNDISFWEIIGVVEPLPFDNIKYIVFAVYLCIGSVIGAIGSVVSTTKHLKV